MERHKLLADSFVRCGISLLEGASNYIHFGLRLRQCDAWSQATNGHQPMIHAFGIPRACWIYRLPEVIWVPIEGSEPRRHDSHDSGNNARGGESFSENIGIAVEMSFPEGVADDNGLSKFPHFFGDKNPAEDWPYAEKTEEVRREVLHVNGLGSIDAGYEAASVSLVRPMSSKTRFWFFQSRSSAIGGGCGDSG